ncbi:MAG: bifunctional diaminohydroxyphosphoribosylaminopyrimidine deaminase/5-amino-6-(5-phosphoribosylamino)uracil reductase RibD, partial [Bacteroidales bacterium]|nr:bifunctional diaminohydroxyphosphoribosylaminopyrimidine deaminase/5-amino-6-(5-phosphoribosylamino)uracil reductase RibD [Bacteroidales bacterium]
MFELDKKYMLRCLELAAKGLGYVKSNPLVGCLIVKNGAIISEGYHHAFGMPHAERVAIDKLDDKTQIKDSTIYVNLEPCSHYGKTPPCAPYVAKMSPHRVVISDIDPNPLVNNQGIKILQDAGIQVDIGICSLENRKLNKRFFTFIEKKRPYIILKWAQTLDGFIAEKNQNCIKWISNAATRQIVHKWRAEEMAILVGAGTVRCDDPQLTTRHWYGDNPIRMVVTNSGNLPLNAKIFDNQAKTILFYKNILKTTINEDKIDIVKIETDFIDTLYAYCIENNITSILIEGGSQLLNTFINREQWDEARVIVGNKVFGQGVRAPIISRHTSIDIENIDDDRIIHY